MICRAAHEAPHVQTCETWILITCKYFCENIRKVKILFSNHITLNIDVLVSTSIRSTGCCGSGGGAGCIRRAVCSCCRASRPPTTTPPPSGRRCVDNVDIYEISTKYLHYKYLGPGHSVRGQLRGIQIHSRVQVKYCDK